jgi:hypothetical protein
MFYFRFVVIAFFTRGNFRKMISFIDKEKLSGKYMIARYRYFLAAISA